MKETLTIDIVAQAKDKTKAVIESIKKGFKSLGDSADNAKKKTKGLGEETKSTQRTLRAIAKEKYEIILQAKDRAQPVISGLKSSLKGIAGKTFRVTLRAVDFVTAPARKVLGLLTSIQGMIFGAAGTAGGIVAPMDISGDYEQTQIAFSTMLKSTEKANKFLKEASDFANKTPFEFPDLINSSRLLLAFGFNSDSIFNTLETIGDTSSGLGAGSEGIDRITRALGQMKAKGRVLTEELMQLQELGIPINEILQQEMGLTREQVANIGYEDIAADPAIEAILRGLDKRYGGMMTNQSKTSKGLMSTISDTFSNTFMRRWGTGLWAGVKPGLEKITGWLDNNPDEVEEWASKLEQKGTELSTSLMNNIDKIGGRISDMMKSPEWENSDFFGKIRISWDRLIAEPFSEWWNSSGRKKITDTAENFGNFLGSGLSAGILGLLGVNDSGVLGEGMSVGESFAEGFISGFRGDKVKQAIKDAIGDIFSSSYFGGGDSLISTLLVGKAGLGALSIGAKALKGGHDMYSAGKILTGLFKAGGSGTGGTVPTVPASGLGAVSVSGLATVTSSVLAVLGMGLAIKDFVQARSNPLTYERNRQTRTAAIKGGAIGMGAVIGSLVAPGVGTALGAGAGALVGFLGGDAISSAFKTEAEKVHDITMRIGEDLKDSMADWDEATANAEFAENLIKQYQELEKQLGKGNDPEITAGMEQIVDTLNGMFPDLIGNYEYVNGLSQDRIDLLERELEKSQELAEYNMRKTYVEGRENIPGMNREYREVSNAISEKESAVDKGYADYKELAELKYKYEIPVTKAVDSGNWEEINRLNSEIAASAREIMGNSSTVIDFGSLTEAVKDYSDAYSSAVDELTSLYDKKSELETAIQTYYSGALEVLSRDAGFDNFEDVRQQIEDIQTIANAINELDNQGMLTGDLNDAVTRLLPGFSSVAGDADEKADFLRESLSNMTEPLPGLIGQISELNESLDALPSEKKVKISIDMPSVPRTTDFVLGNYNYKNKVGKSALGRITNGPMLSWIGEDGPEAVIPLSGKYRKRGLALFEKAGDILGVRKNAEGGVYQAGTYAVNNVPESSKNSSIINVSVNTPPANITVNGSNLSENIIKNLIESALKDYADILTGQIAENLKIVTANMT